MGKRVLVCEAGSIGRRHIANLLQLGLKVSVWRTRGELLTEFANYSLVQVCINLLNAISRAEVVVVVTASDWLVCRLPEVLRRFSFACTL